MTDLEDFTVYLSVRSDQYVSKTDLKLKILSLGLKVAGDFTAANFVVYHNGSKETITKAKAKGFPVVNACWVNSCFGEKYLLPWRDFEIPEPGQSESRQENDRCVRTVAESRDEIFKHPRKTSDVHISLSRPSEIANPTSGLTVSGFEAKRIPFSENNTGDSIQQVAEKPNRGEALVPYMDIPSTAYSNSNQENGACILLAISGLEKEPLYPLIKEMGANYLENPYDIVSPREAASSSSSSNVTGAFEASLAKSKLLLESTTKLHACNWSIDSTFLERCPAVGLRTTSCEDRSSKVRNGYLVLVDTTDDEEFRSAKHILCYALGAPIVHQSWLHQCHSHRKVHDTLSFHTNPYQAHIKKRLHWFSQNQVVCSDSSHRPQIFKSLSFYMWGEFSCPKQHEIALVISLAGGNVITKKPRKKKSKASGMKEGGMEKVFVVYSEEDKRLSWKAQGYAPIHQSDIFNSIEKCTCTFYIVK